MLEPADLAWVLTGAEAFALWRALTQGYLVIADSPNREIVLSLYCWRCRVLHRPVVLLSPGRGPLCLIVIRTFDPVFLPGLLEAAIAAGVIVSESWFGEGVFLGWAGVASAHAAAKGISDISIDRMEQVSVEDAVAEDKQTVHECRDVAT